jgi:hypothetical protein
MHQRLQMYTWMLRETSSHDQKRDMTGLGS